MRWGRALTPVPLHQPFPVQILGEHPREALTSCDPSAAHLEDAALRVDVGDAKHDDGPPEVVHWVGRQRERGYPQTSGREPPSCSPGVGGVGVLRGPHRQPGTEGREARACPGCGRALGSRNGQSSRKAAGKGRAQSTHQSQFPRTLCLEPLRAGWLHGRSRRPAQGRPRQVRPSELSPFSSRFQLPLPQSHPHLLVLLQGHAGLSPVLGLNEEQLVPLDVLEDALEDTAGQCGRRRVPLSGVLAKLSSARLSGLQTTPLPRRPPGRAAAPQPPSRRKPVIPAGNRSPYPPLNQWGRHVAQDGQSGPSPPSH